jgi:hypothetical protein
MTVRSLDRAIVKGTSCMDLFRLSALMLLLPLLSCSGDTRALQEVRLAAVGDIMLGRYIGKVMKAKGDHYPFAQVKTMLKDHDIVFGNLESGFATDTSAPFFPGKPYNFAALPGAAPALREAGFTVLNLANNHILDFGVAELDLTRTLLRKEGIQAFGAGGDLQAARLPAGSRCGASVGFLGYGVAHSSAVYVRKDRPGIVPIQKEYIREDIQALRKTVDILVISYHWGMEYEQHPTDAQRDLAHLTIDWGADMVLGHHPMRCGDRDLQGEADSLQPGEFRFRPEGHGNGRQLHPCLHVRPGKPAFRGDRARNALPCSPDRGRSVTGEDPGRTAADLPAAEFRSGGPCKRQAGPAHGGSSMSVMRYLFLQAGRRNRCK